MIYRAPSREENVAGPREFAYVAEIDITGWKFRLMYDGSFQIDLPTLPEGGSPMFACSPATTDLLRALLSASDGPGTLAQFTSSAAGLGSVAS
jgi:hypothetical protein